MKERNPNAFYEIGDEVLHPRIGFGIVQDAIPHDRWTQKIHVHFENNTDGVFTAKELCKVINGKYGKIHSLREAFQKGKAKDRSGQAADLGRAKSRHPEARKQQGLQPKQSPRLEA